MQLFSYICLGKAIPTMNTFQEDITKVSIQLILNEPFYGHYLATLAREVTDKVSTMSIASGESTFVKLFINEKFWNEVLTTEDFKCGVLKHEILHIVFKHILLVDTFMHKDLGNIAMDMVVNQYIKREQLPGHPILIENYPGLNLERNQDVAYYYNKLYRAYTQKNDSATINQLQKDLTLFRQSDSIDNHQLWKKLSGAEKRVMELNIKNTLEQVIKRSKKSPTYGRLPSGLLVYLKQQSKVTEPPINWRRILRLFTTSSRQTFLKNTIKRPSKRYGSVPGIKVRHKYKLLVVIDTSRSISTDEITVFFHEIYHIFRQGAEIMIVECDSLIQNSYLYHGEKPILIQGRGGTDFNAPIEFANTEYAPDAIIYFTDGYAPSPKITPIAPILWLISKDGLPKEEWNKLPGQKVKMTHQTAKNA